MNTTTYGDVRTKHACVKAEEDQLKKSNPTLPGRRGWGLISKSTIKRMRNLSIRTAAINPPAAAAYIDTTEWFFRQVPSGVREDVEKIIRKRVRIKDCTDRNGRLWGRRLCVNLPSAELLQYMSQLQQGRRCVVSRVDIALDFITDTREQADAIGFYLKHHLVLLWRPRGKNGTFGQKRGTVYWMAKRRYRRPNRNLVLYSDRPARGWPLGHPARMWSCDSRILELSVARAWAT
jgi:hypothetical protein